MPALEVAAPTQEGHNEGPINPVVGIIYPPPEVRSILSNVNKFLLRNN